MSTYALMRVLESAPRRYDRGIRILTLGRVDRAYDWLAGWVGTGDRVLDIGCGTGALGLRATRRGAKVRGIDTNPEMLDQARRRFADEQLDDRVELVEEGVADLDGEPAAAFDVVMIGLCLSELSPDEIAYTITQVHRLLEPGGLLLVADEMVPDSRIARLALRILRLPMAVVAFLLTGQVTHPVGGLAEQLREVGIAVVERRRSPLGAFASLVARNGAAPAAPRRSP